MIGQLLDGRYEIVQVLGGGAFGKTFLAKDLKRPTQPQCVVKQLSYSSQDPLALNAASRLFKKEAEILEKLGRHDQIPTLLAEFEQEKEFYLVQQLIDGHPLHQEIQPHQRWNEQQVLQLLTEVLPILVFVHGQGVIHRDIKPSNLMRRSADGKLVLIDFGAVKDISSQIPQGQLTPTAAIGTAAYMPMEQFHGFPQYNSDIYALGMIAIQALLGLPAHDLTKLRDNTSPNLGEIVWRNQVAVSPALADVIDKMVLTDWRRRYQSANEVLADLSKIPAYSPSFSPTPTKITPNNQPQLKIKFKPSIVKGVAAVIVVAGIGFAVYHQLPTTKALPFYKRGLEKLHKDKSEAIKEFNEAIKLNDKYAEAYYQRANAHFLANNYQRAAEDASKAIELKENYFEAYTRLCAALLLLQQPQQAEAKCTKAIEINPKYADAYLNRANARRNLKNKDGALADLTKLIDLNLDDPQAYISRGVFYIEFQEYEKAIADYNQALKLATNKPEIAAIAYDGRGNALAAQNKAQAAIDDFTQAIEHKKDFAQAYFNRGRIYKALNSRQEAIQDFEKADTLCSQQGRTNCSKLAQSFIQELQDNY
ncbi:tetratricopeptide repeat protein [Tolypothrix sp. FACHB-123]|uniref:serine/threonine-protein kinase n=1 Tax=Tolypothrix sp. FACHB-123 TaxID=2692868 RepID=UPI0016891893|nr:serine/threonine-protein kinase [Tolypothrix sp. FACHB-123]MBD2353255.1 tetratricopeptide repeat protein [Tolypothrix sp. FACHB-123]